MLKSMCRFPTASGLLLAAMLALPATSGRAQAQPATASSGGSASASGSGAGLGIGAAAFVSGLAGVDVTYDLARFHIDGILGFNSWDAGNNRTRTSFDVGARGWYHLHTGTNSDFSLGGGLGFRTASGGGAPSATATLLEPGMQARAFLTPNFAFNMTAGLSLVFGDSVNGTSTGFGLGAQLLGGIGFTYFFR